MLRNMFLTTASLIAFATATMPAQAKTTTTVGQVHGTPSGGPGQTVDVHGGLSYFSWPVHNFALYGPVSLYYAQGTRWVFVGTTNALGTEWYGWSGDSFALARFRMTIPSNSRRGTYIRVKFVYGGNNYYSGSTGYGDVYVQ